MENENKKNVFKKLIEKIKKIWDRLGQPDVEDLIGVPDLDKDTAQKVAKIEAVQAKVHEQKGFDNIKARVNETEAQEVARRRGRRQGQQKIIGDA